VHNAPGDLQAILRSGSMFGQLIALLVEDESFTRDKQINAIHGAECLGFASSLMGFNKLNDCRWHL
ncbi:MAG: hypothetical protein GTO41_16855, partial [Burkholderiales bacterium]|nr:hypothetical protein [Burkholderiales bacterium]